MPYIFDSNCFIEGWHRTYSPAIMPDYWELLSADIKTGEIISPRQVMEEINKKDDELRKWLQDKKDRKTFVPKLSTDEKQKNENNALNIVKEYPKILKRQGKMEADPYVIALAQLRNGTVVTTERDNHRLGDKHKIPAVCRDLKIKCINPMQHIKERGWEFVKK